MTLLHGRNRFGFGDENAAALPRAEISRRFVGFGGDETFGGLAVVDDDSSTQIYVSARGGGRTMYMRRAELVQRGLAGARGHVLHSDNHLPISSDIVLRLADHFGDSDQVVKWQLLWRAATLITVASHLLYNDDLGRPLSADAVFAMRYRDFLGLGAIEEPTTVYAQLVRLERRFRGLVTEPLVDHLHSQQWVQLEQRLIRALPACPPLILYIEGPDAEVRHAPTAWLACQKGLYYFAWHFPDHADLAEHVRVVATVREVVYSSVLEGDKGDAFGTRVRRLIWTVPATRRFLEDKVSLLGETELMQPATADPVAAWLGHSTIFNARLGKTELLSDYLVTHTFLSPREIVHLGNALTAAVRAAKRTNATAVDEHVIRETVRGHAALFGRQRLVGCATELVARVGEQLFEEYADITFPGKRFARADGLSIADVLVGVFADIGQVRFTRQRFADAAARLLPDVGQELLHVLWRHRVVGYVSARDTAEEEVFFTAGEGESLRLPAAASELAIHRALIDTVELKIVETAPIRLRPDVPHEAAGTRPASEPDPAAETPQWNMVFISHASEDKAEIVIPLAKALEERGWRPWVDRYELHVGDSLVGKIDQALAEAQFGILILSPAFFSKQWPRAEMDALVSRELAETSTGMVLPVRHGVTHEDVAHHSPLLAGRLSVSTEGGIAAVADQLNAAMSQRQKAEEEDRRSGGALLAGVPAVPTTREPIGRGDGAVELLEELKRLLPAVLEEVIFRLGVPAAHLSPGPQSTRAIELINYVGPKRLDELRAAIGSART